MAKTLKLWGRLALVSAGWEVTFLLKAGAVEDIDFRSDPWWFDVLHASPSLTFCICELGITALPWLL